MRFLVDESSDARLALYLSELGHDATTVARDYTASIADPEVLAIARHERRVLITNDSDFGELIFRDGLEHSGVIFLRLSTTRLSEKIARVAYVLAHHSHDLDQFIVVTDRTIRVRRTPTEQPPA
jgi:predicted nuclease of predicted toxin-antitoxin system